eukprot:m.235702 g.235702  ORF g.235702 m.235702 type:complete len:181 (-) comp26162_c1_seq1:1774-2316(-)
MYVPNELFEVRARDIAPRVSRTVRPYQVWSWRLEGGPVGPSVTADLSTTMDIFNTGTKVVKDSMGMAESMLLDRSRAPPFGPGDPQAEAKACAQIRLFLRASHRTGFEKMVLLVPPDTKISTVKETWGKQEGFTKLTQPQVRDEFGYVVGSSDMDKPLTNFSNKCNLNLDFTHPQFIGKV